MTSPGMDQLTPTDCHKSEGQGRNKRTDAGSTPAPAPLWRGLMVR